MPDKLDSIIAKIKTTLEQLTGERKSGQVTFVINLSQGGVKDCEVQTKERLK